MGFYHRLRGCSEPLFLIGALIGLAVAIMGAIYRDELRDWEFDSWKNMGVNPDLAMGSAAILAIATKCVMFWARKRND